jgi:prevent-host-death family protein
MLRMCYDRRMSEIASRELRNDTAGVLQRVQAGDNVIITVNGKGVARLVPLQPIPRRWLSRDELASRLNRHQADAGLRTDLHDLAGGTTDDLGPIE